MKLAFFNNSLNHHQVYVADELYTLLGNDYVYVSTSARENINLKGGTDYSSRPYCLFAEDSDENRLKALELAKTAEVCIFGAESLKYAIERAKHPKCGLAFELSERWLKRGWINILSPRLIKWWIAYQRYFRTKPFFKLNASGFAASDHSKLYTYQNRCFKWGYFTQVDILDDEVFESTGQEVRLMWCSRFIDWKHPELPVLMANRLVELGISFHLDMFGDGRLRAKTESMVKKFGLQNKITFYGNVANTQIHKAMRKADIFIFTSNKQEGWGAVMNEAMANGCAVVASDAIGSTPYLVRNGYNGFAFKSGSVDSITASVTYLILHPAELQEMKRNAYNYMRYFWSPQKAALSLLQLIDDINNGKESSIKEGPCSKA